MSIFRPRTSKQIRREMVRRQVVRRGISNRRVVSIMAWVPRELFVPDDCKESAYADTPLPIGDGQTISQPYIVALMTMHASLRRTSRVLEIGTGSGYHTAILAKIAQHVYSIERVGHFVPLVRRRLETLRIKNVTLNVGDGTAGYRAAAPYDAIVVAAAAKEPPAALLDQLAIGGRLVIPLGGRESQMLTVIRRTELTYDRTPVSECRFVPFVTG